MGRPRSARRRPLYRASRDRLLSGTEVPSGDAARRARPQRARCADRLQLSRPSRQSCGRDQAADRCRGCHDGGEDAGCSRCERCPPRDGRARGGRPRRTVDRWIDRGARAEARRRDGRRADRPLRARRHRLRYRARLSQRAEGRRSCTQCLSRPGSAQR